MNELTIQEEFFAAICHNEAETVRKLLAEGAEVNARFANGLSPLMVAVRAGAHTVVSVLAAAGADVHAQDAAGATAFHYLCRWSMGSSYHREAHTESARALLAAGADAYAVDAVGESPFWLACSAGLKNVVRLIHAQHPIPIEARDAQGDTPLLRAARSIRGSNLVGMLLCMGCDPQVVGADGKRLEDFPCYYPGLMVYRELSEELRAWYTEAPEPRPEINTADDIAWARRVELHAQDKRGFTPLHHAASQGLYDVALVLLERGAEVDARSRSAATPLMLAARCGRWKVGSLLLAHGADATLRDCHGYNALQFAQRAGNHKLAWNIACTLGSKE